MNKTRFVILAATLLATVAVGSLVGPSNIDPIDKWSWGENIGWMNWRDADATNEGVVLESDHLHGFIWAENLGWINVGDGGGPYANTSGLDFGVNRLGNDDLDGMAWSENKGWINFGWAAGPNDPDRGRFDSTTGRFRGFVWGENIGWINLDDNVHFVAVDVVTGTVDPPVADDSFDRTLGMTLSADSAGTNTAYRVRLVSLYHPNDPQPANQPDYSGSEGEVRYLNLLRDGNGNVVTECVSSAAQATTYPCITVGCEPEFADWGTLFGGVTAYVSGNSIIPDSAYTIAHLASTCTVASAATCSAASEDVPFTTARYGDAQPDGLVTVADVVLTVDAVKQLPGSSFEYQVYIRKQHPVPQTEETGVGDIVAHVDALKLFAYLLPISSCP